jgi:hypothetical protein
MAAKAEVEGKTRRRRAAAPVVELIVRRSAIRRFDKLKQATADLAVKLSWDRRTSEHQHRQIERRQAPPFTWEVADFVVVEKPALRAPCARAKTKRRS